MEGITNNKKNETRDKKVHLWFSILIWFDIINIIESLLFSIIFFYADKITILQEYNRGDY